MEHDKFCIHRLLQPIQTRRTCHNRWHGMQGLPCSWWFTDGCTCSLQTLFNSGPKAFTYSNLVDKMTSTTGLVCCARSGTEGKFVDGISREFWHPDMQLLPNTAWPQHEDIGTCLVQCSLFLPVTPCVTRRATQPVLQTCEAGDGDG